MPPAGRSQWGRGGKQPGWEGDRTQQPSEEAEVSPSWAPQSRSFGPLTDAGQAKPPAMPPGLQAHLSPRLHPEQTPPMRPAHLCLNLLCGHMHRGNLSVP